LFVCQPVEEANKHQDGKGSTKTGWWHLIVHAVNCWRYLSAGWVLFIGRCNR